MLGEIPAIAPRRERGGFQALRLSPVLPMKTPVHSRRNFIKTGIAGIVAAGVGPQLISARLLGANAPSKQVTLGCIGLAFHGSIQPHVEFRVKEPFFPLGVGDLSRVDAL